MLFSKRCLIFGVNNSKNNKVCKSCGTSFYESQSEVNFDLSSDDSDLSTREDGENSIWECEECGSEITEDDKVCPNCGVVFEQD